MDTLEDAPPPMDSMEDLPPLPDVFETWDAFETWDTFETWDAFETYDVFETYDMFETVDLVEDIPKMPPACCLSDADCEDIGDGGWTCAWGEMQAENPDWGRCMGPVTWEDDLCWDDGDCAEGLTCMGASYCPCDMGCGMADTPGSCQDPDALGDVGDLCGQSGGDCKPDLVCCYPCGIPGCQWQCAVPCDEDEQWCAGGCPMLP